MVTKRNTRSFVAEELTADERDIQLCQTQSAALRKGSTPNLLESFPEKDVSNSIIHGTSNGTCTSSSSPALDDLPIAVNLPTMERTTSLSSSKSSSGASYSSSAYSSASSNASEAFLSAADSGLLAEEITSPHQSANIAVGAPLNFGQVVSGLYRSSYPQPENYAYLKSLGLKTIVTLVDKNFTEGYQKFMSANNIQHHVFGMKGTKKEEIPLSTMEAILRLVLNRQNYPLLIHCNHGKHRTGCVVAVVRKICGWNNERIVHEYRTYAGIKERDCDVKYMRAFELSHIASLVADETLHVDEGPAQSAAVGFRVPHFLRAAFVSMTVLFIWMISGSKMQQHHRRH
ncbi:tyrosine phosphatase family protein [Grosmannia clavigera kw1407]|uniref:diphosphoinositol-polyphosphate diphosphatase n=1 Tax=Grosmannia clavigera (strain kw1407 / UAMH 11150) TaxID=655863 RepID=F0X6R3_GROCL|nr:tyrosine phosphatase family protein [Grosmannia clavigera kw1407]EFX06447.1 tyrosine phosphatase family protein [Grosmannia clavigera kw1407]